MTVNYSPSIPGNPIPFVLISTLETGACFCYLQKEPEKCKGNNYLCTVPCTHKILRVHGLFGSLAWASDHARVAEYARVAESCPATWAWLGPARKNNSSKKFVIF
jgi:hypothetical protein